MVAGVRLTDGLYRTKVDRPSSPAVVAVWALKAHFHSLWCSTGFVLHGWLTGIDSGGMGSASIPLFLLR
ncbi:hypothetical protein [Ammoniphilus resinae]|uniref:Uncharacterized protein n=1 Tax=Ammoniphilus resinae TaxID=861532 RepID=A0ABS4GSB9_9BACL|nr:hypothetical protein [Ammoniphilus resinae]MBP1933183.1 hypothetical protein [Ammoniphilus resinae]